jgi:hypothetical protein
MKIFYNKPVPMARLDCKKKPGLAKQLLRHDPEMAASMYRITFDVIKNDISAMGKFSVNKFADQDELLKALELFYEKDKNKARVMIMNVVAEIASYDKRMNWREERFFEDDHDLDDNIDSDDVYDPSNKMAIDKFGKLFSRVLKDYPEYAITIRYKIMKRACRIMGLDYKKLFAELDMTKASKKLFKAIEKSDDSGVFMAMAGRAFADNDYMYVPNKNNRWFNEDEENKHYENQIEWLNENFSDKPEMASSLLLLRLK